MIRTYVLPEYSFATRWDDLILAEGEEGWRPGARCHWTRRGKLVGHGTIVAAEVGTQEGYRHWMVDRVTVFWSTPPPEEVT